MRLSLTHGKLPFDAVIEDDGSVWIKFPGWKAEKVHPTRDPTLSVGLIVVFEANRAIIMAARDAVLKGEGE